MKTTVPGSGDWLKCCHETFILEMILIFKTKLIKINYENKLNYTVNFYLKMNS